MEDSKLAAMTALRKAMHHCNEIGLQTYGRKPHEMRETHQWQKLQMAEAMARTARGEIEQALAILESSLPKARPFVRSDAGDAKP
jgi:hypothetical protein